MKTLRTALLAFTLAAAAVAARAASVSYVPAGDIAVPELQSYLLSGHSLQFLTSGKLLLGGPFTTVNGVPRAHFARLHSSGAIDAGFEVDSALPAGDLQSGPMYVHAGGRVYYAAGPDSLDAAPSVLRRLAPDGGRDSNFELTATLQAPTAADMPRLARIFAGNDGRMLVTGRFDKLGGLAANNAALLRADGSVEATFDLVGGGEVQHALPLADGRWIIVRDTSIAADQPPGLLVERVLASGVRDATYTSFLFSRGGVFYGAHAFAVDSAGRLVFAEWALNSLGQESNLQIGRLMAEGGRDSIFAAALPRVFGPTELPFDGVATPLLYIPPRVSRIVPRDGGALHCIAPYADAEFRGILDVSATGLVTASSILGDSEDTVNWLVRDQDGAWWAELGRSHHGATEAYVARLHPAGVDPAFAVTTRASGAVTRVQALDDGASLIQGSFHFADAIASPGIVIVESDGSVRSNRSAGSMPWGRAEFVASLADGSMVVARPVPRVIYWLAGAVQAEVVSEDAEPVPVFGRLFPDGRWTGYHPGVNDWYSPRIAWLDAAQRLLAVVPGGLASESARSDVLRFSASGVRDGSYRALAADGSVLSVQAAAPDADGAHVWALAYSAPRTSLHRLGADGRSTSFTALVPWSATSSYGAVRTVAGVAAGALVGGSFDELNSVLSPGVALIGADGRVDRVWGGWLRERSSVEAIRLLANGLVHVTGRLFTPLGEEAAVLLRASDGLPDFNANPVLGHRVEQWPLSVSQSGEWVHRAIPHAGTPAGFVSYRGEAIAALRRWRATSVPDVALTVAPATIRKGDPVMLNVDWAGIPLFPSTWLRDGVHAGTGVSHAFVAQPEDDGAVFVAQLHSEGGASTFSRPVRIDIRDPWARLVNGSIRARAGVGDETLVVGCTFAGGGRGQLLTRALGPGLEDLGVVGAAGAVSSRLVRSDGGLIDPPADYVWMRSMGGAHPDIVAAARSVGAYRPELLWLHGNDQMLYPSPGVGASHFQVGARTAPQAGVALAEIFSIGSEQLGRRGLWLKNFSGRARVSRQHGENLIGGLVVGGDRSLRLLIRAAGPALGAFGVAGVSTNPMLELHGAGTMLASSDNWGETRVNRSAVIAASALAGAFPFQEGSADAALVVDLPPGVYTVVVGPTQSTTAEFGGGIALLEVYALD